MKQRYSVLCSMMMAAGLLSASLTAAEGYYRSPALAGNQIVFTAEGDLWLSNLQSPAATRLTSHPAEENQPLLSPDGKAVAFVADYDGTPEIYVMPLSGGTAQRISFENSRVKLQQWLADGRILYSTDNAVGPANYWVLKTVDPKTLQNHTLPLADAVAGVMDERSSELFFVRFGLQLTGDNAKVYRGGAMGELWRWTNDSKQEAILLSKAHQGSISQPMFWQGRVYFVSDASGNSNIWSVNRDGSDFRQHTQHADWRIGRASLDNGRIVYQLGADLYQLDLADNSNRLLPIQLASDFVQKRERWLDKPLQYFNDASYTAGTEQVVITARGHIALAATDKRRLVQIATPVNSRSRNAVLSKDAKWVYTINDSSGEHEIWRFAADGSAKAEQLTKDGKVFRWQLSLSPDGNWLAHDDKNGDLWLLNLKSGENRRIYSGAIGLSPYSDLVWAANSKLLAFSLNTDRNSRTQVGLYHLAEQQSSIVTSDKYDSFSPAFSPDSLWLYFVSNRQFTATPGHPWGDRNLGPMFDKRGQIFAVSLKQQACFPFQPVTEVITCDNKTANESREGRRGSLVDWDGLAQRLWQVPVAAGNYQQLALTEQRLYLLEQNGNKTDLKQLKTEPQPKLEVFASDVASYQLPAGSKKLFYRKQPHNAEPQFFLADATDKAPSDLSNVTVQTNSWQLSVNPVNEWQQMFHDAWLMQREFLFDKNMRGLDWDAVKAKYQPLVNRVSDRYELDDLLAQMMGELNALHSQVRGGEYRQRTDKVNAASLGALLQTHADGVKISHIYQTEAELPNIAAPLAKPGVNARAGDLIVAINGRNISNQAELTQQLRNQAGKQVLLTLQRGNSRHQTVVEPVSAGNEAMLRYQDWVWRNQQQVTQHSNQRFGYLHLYAMGPNDIANFAREFYANYQKEGLIIDVRRNRGGNIDSWIIEKLLRRSWAYWQPTQGGPYTNMQQAFRGQLVVLADALTYSDGETFSAGVRALELGPLIGRKTAGAGVWLTGRNLLTDRGVARVAETAQFAMDGRWIIEGEGVSPDIDVNNLPYATFSGSDAQLDAAINYLQQALDKTPLAPLNTKPLTTPFAADIKP